MTRVLRQLRLRLGHDLLDASIHLAQVFTRGRHIDIHRALDLVMVHLGRRRNAGDADDRIQAGGLFEVRRPEGHAAKIGQILHVALPILDGQQVIVPALGINPIARGNHAVGGQRRDQAVGDLLGAEPQLAGALAINVNLQSRVIHILRDQHVADPGQGAHLAGDLAGDVVQAPCKSMLLTWMSSGAGMPWLRMASTRPPVWK